MDITRLFCLIDDFLKALEEDMKKKQDRVHRFDFAECMPSKKNLQKQSFQRTRREREIDERLVFRIQIIHR